MGFRRGASDAATSSRSSGTEWRELLLLPEQERIDLCMEALAEAGARNIWVNERSHEIVHSCALPYGHTDSNPSAALNYERLVYHCFAGETLVKTWDGPQSLADLAGGRHLLIDGNGQWIEAEVREFGIQALRKITLQRNKVVKIVYATGNHRWFRQTKGLYADGRQGDLVELTTDDLRPGHRLPSVWTSPSDALAISPQGVARGFTYGDGTTITSGARAYFCGPKDRHLFPYFAPSEVKYDSRGVGRIDGLPRTWKVDLPEMDEGADYLYGWLAGYLAADGHVTKRGFASIASAKREPLEWVSLLCDRLGIKVLGISEQMRKGYGSEPTSLYTLRFARGALPEEFFIIPEHRRRVAGATSSFERTHWTVLSVEETDRVEPVYCAVVPTTHSFVLDDSLLTGNCWACGGGSLFWFLATTRGDETTDPARRWFADRVREVNTDPDNVDKVLAYIDAVYSVDYHPRAQIPKMSPRVLDPWRWIHPWMTEVRGIPEATMEAFQVGWNPDEDRIVIPHFWRGDLVGWQTRRLGGDGPKYHSTPDFPKDTTLYNADGHRDVIVVESPMSVLSKHHLTPNLVATFGASITDRQMQLLGNYDRVVVWMDNDTAGWNAVMGTEARKGLAEVMPTYTPTFIVSSPYAADPADLDDDTYQTLLSEAVPAALWTPPTELTPWEDPCRSTAPASP